MKPVILSFILLIGVMLAVAWMNGRFGTNLNGKNKEISENSLYFEPETSLTVGGNGEINLMAKNTASPITSFWINFNFDSPIVKVDSITVNKDVFDVVDTIELNQTMGIVTIRAKSNLSAANLKTGIQKLATLKIEGLKKGTSTFVGVRRPEVTIFENGKSTPGNFQMVPFRVGVK